MEKDKTSTNIITINKPTNRYDPFLFLTVVALVLIGIFAVFSSSAYIAQYSYNRSTFFVEKQILFVIIGSFAMFTGMRIDFFQLRSYLKPLFFFTTFFLMATYFPFLGGTTINGANGWIRIPVINFGFQPSEVAKILMIVFSANLLANPEYYRLNLIEKIITIAPILGILGIVIFQPDMGNTSVIFLSVFSIFFVAGLKVSKILVTTLVVSVIFAFLAYNNPYQMDRLTNFTDPWKDRLGKGFQLVQSLIAIGSGGIFGKGLGQGMQKLFYLPESHTDFIFSVICEEGGLVGALLILLLFFFLAQRGFQIALKSKDIFIKLLTTGATSLICGQALMNIGVSIGVLPTTGITLPFISYGGTSLIINFFCVGLILNASRYIENKADDSERKPKNNKELSS